MIPEFRLVAGFITALLLLSWNIVFVPPIIAWWLLWWNGGLNEE